MKPGETPDLTWDTSAFDNSDEYQFEWDFMCKELTDFMDKINLDGDWHCTVENFGWDNRSGYQDFSTCDGANLLSKVLPSTECTFKVWLDEEGKKITIDNAHHDKPTGGEIYVITPQEKEDE